jgi:hypothetical protein
MKKFMILSAAALVAVCFASCDKNGNTTNLDEAVEDGFYVAGEATGVNELKPAYMMTAGINEAADQTKRSGMYEKYIVLQGGKDFDLKLYEAGKKTRYSATLAEFTPEEGSTIYGEDPQMAIMKGELKTGDTAPAMKVAATGLYHIVLDLNKAGDLANAQIIVAPVEWGVRGAMNGWGFTKMEATEFSNEGITYTIKDAEMSKNGEFKFAYGGAWKITLDDAGKVRANTNLGNVQEGVAEDALAAGGKNIKVEKAGLYDITLTFKLTAGELGASYKSTIKLTQESTLPEEMYMIGEGIQGWNLAVGGDAVAMHPFHSQPGQFWAIRYIEAGKGFKFSPINTDWGKDFTDLGNATGFTVSDGNCFVAESGLYTLQVDYAGSKVIVEPAVIVGMAEPFGNENWNKDLESARFTINGKLASYTTVAAGQQIRTCVVCTLSGDWWHAEFIPKDGKIVYREAGGDPEMVAIEAGKKITYDFNAGTGVVE